MFVFLLSCLFGLGMAAGEVPDGCEEIDAPFAWALDRIDQRESLYYGYENNPRAKYTLGPYRGTGVTVYVVGTGIDIDHPEFEGRASWGYTDPCATETVDDSGYGTHMAGIIGSKSYGVAKNVTLVAVKVHDENRQGTFPEAIAGLKWVLRHHLKRTKKGDPLSVVCVPFLGPKYDELNKVLEKLVEKNAVVVGAAGNNNGDACDRTPASAIGTIAVASMNIRDRASMFSNWGSCVHLYAPGLKIISTWPGNSSKIESGTAQSAAHVAGVVALKMEQGQMTGEEMKAWLVESSTKDALSYPDNNHKTTPNRLLYLNCLLPEE